MRHLTLAVLAALLVVFSASAATFERIPTDRELLDRADLVVVATVLDSTPREGADRMIYTDHRLHVHDVIKGEISAQSIVVSQLGGLLNGRGVLVPGSAEYSAGSRVLAFLGRAADGTYFTRNMAFGRYRFVRSTAGNEVLVRDTEGLEADHTEAINVRDASTFVEALRSGAPDKAPRSVRSHQADALLPAEEQISAPAANYMHKVGGVPLRWKNGGTFAFTINGTQGSLDKNLAFNTARGAWNSAAPSINITKLSDGTKTGAVNDDVNDVIFGYTGSPQSVQGLCDGSLGCAVVYYNGPPQTHNFDGSTFYDIVSTDAVIFAGTFSQNSLTAVLGHEIGHGLGFRHSESEQPSSNDALMRGQPPNGPGPDGLYLREWDKEAAAEAYGTGFPCAAVQITGVTGGGDVDFNSQPRLTATTTGKTPITHQWYRGQSPNTANPIAGATGASMFADPVTQTAHYWVQAKNCSGQSVANSQTVTVTPKACDAPAFFVHPQSQRIAPGTTAILTVDATGTAPLTFAWFEGQSGDTSKLVAGNVKSFTTPALNQATSYWARVSNNCGTRNSQTAVITVGVGCIAATIDAHPQNADVFLGDTATLTVTPSGDAPFTFQWYEGEAPDQSKPINGATSASYKTPVLTTAGSKKYWVRIENACGSANSNSATVTAGCPAPVQPSISAPSITHHTAGYIVDWSGNTLLYPTYELQEATDKDFTENLKTFVVTGALSQPIDAKTTQTGDRRYWYRVRGISACTNLAGPYSAPTSTFVTGPVAPDSSTFSLTVPEGSKTSFGQPFLVAGFGQTATSSDTYGVAIDVPWLTASPASGALPAAGVTVMLTVNPASLEAGTTTATITVTRNQGSGKMASHASSTSTLPFSISLVTPVTPAPRDTNPPPGTLVIPAIAHAQGVDTRFQTDVRIVNSSNDAITYELSFTPSGTNGTATGKKTTLTINGRDSKGLDDIVKNWYGSGVGGELGTGTLEIRPIGNVNPLATFASSRTYAVTPKGTLGQFIPAIPIAKFIANSASAKLSLQQIAQSPAFRTNVGFVEGGGQTTDLLIKLLNPQNQVIQQIQRTLAPYEHQQHALSILFPNTPVTDGRLEVQVLSQAGKATAYASVVDNKTSDPLMVFPVDASTVSATRYVVPGIAELDNGVSSNFHSSMRIFNASNVPVTVALNYFPQRGDQTPRPQQLSMQIGAFEVKAIDDVLPTLWSLTGTGGSVAVDAPSNVPLVLTARTYSRDADGGTYGQFIPGVTAADAVGVGDPALHVLQLEQSPQYRTNLGVVEVTGKPVTIELMAYKPDSKTSVVTHAALGANEFVQYGRILEQMGLPTVYNGHVTVKVLDGEGRVAAYGSVVDNRTVDPTYVPAQ